MKYNLIRNSYFDSILSSGTGNVDLTWAQLESLMDQNLTSSGVILTTSGVLYLETDLSQRIKVDGIHLYASDLSKSANINFYYKNAESDNYTLLTTYSDASSYYTTISGASAPQFVRVTVSGIAVELYEFLIYNDDYIVAFGQDGQTYAEYLDNAPIGEEGDSQVIAIYNNADSGWPATGYTTIDYTGTAADNYIKISASENGTYRGIEDGAMIEDNNLASTYVWDMGEYDNVSVDNNRLKISETDISQKLGHLPNGTADEAFRTGANTWDWDRVNKKMYVMGLEGTTLSLWDYDYTSDTWNYLTSLAPAVAASDRFAVMSYCDGAVYVISQFTGTFGKYTISGAVNNWTDLPNPTFSGVVIGNQDRVSMCSDGIRYVYALTSDYGESTANRNFRRFDTVTDTWASMDTNYEQYDYLGSASVFTNTSCLTYDYDKDRVYLINASEEEASLGRYIQLYSVSADSWGTNWFNVSTVYNTLAVIESIWYHNKWLYVSCNPYFDTGYFFRYNLDTAEIEKLNLGYVHYNPVSTDIVGVYMIAIDNDSDFGASIYFAQISADRKYLYSYNAASSLNGTYISPILKIADRHSSSYFVVDTTTTSGLTSVSYDSGSYNGTIRVRSSNTEPLVIEEIYLPYSSNDSRIMIPYNGSDTDWLTDWGSSSYNANMGAVDRRTGDVMFCADYSGGRYSYTYKFNRSGSLLYSLYVSGNNGSCIWDHNIEFDFIGGSWGYGNHVSYGTTGRRLTHLDTTLATVLAQIHDSGNDFLHDFAVEMNGDGVWYTDKSLNVVYHLNTDGNILNQIVLQTPRAICGTSDNGCWVMDNTDLKVYRYAFNGNLVKTITLTRYADRMTSDLLDGFWYMRDSTIYHVTSGGVEDTSTMVSQPMMIRAMHTGCVVWSRTTNIVTCIDFNGNITRTFTRSSAAYGLGVYAHDYTDHLNYHTDFLPISYDPVWGTGGSASWREVSKDGYFLPKEQYHQVELTLRTINSTYTPCVNKLLMAPAVKIEDIPSKAYKSMYIKTDIPSGANITDYETKLKTWWRIEE